MDGRRRAVVLGLLAAGLLAGCGRAPEPAESGEGGPGVVATIFPLADVVRRLVGDDVEVISLVQPGSSPHTFDLSPQDAARLERAALVVRVGPGVDDWLPALSDERTLAVIDVTETIQAAPEHGHGDAHGALAPDPHVWLDPIRMRDDIAPALAERLQAALPDHSEAIAQNLSRLQAELTALDSEIRDRLAQVPIRRYLATHPAWRYFSERYDLELAATVEPVGGTEPSAKWLAEVIERARAGGAPVIFTEVQMPPQAAQTVAREANLRVGQLDPLGGEGVPGRDSYVALLRHNAEAFAAGLSGAETRDE